MTKNTATLNDTSLVLTLLTSETPTVWRLDLAQAKEARFTIEKTKKDSFNLVKINAQGVKDVITTFRSQEEAASFLLQISQTLEGKRQPSSSHQFHGLSVPGKEITQWGIAVGGVLIVIGIFAYLSTITPTASQAFSAQTGQVSDVTPAGAGQTGVPISADDFLNAQ